MNVTVEDTVIVCKDQLEVDRMLELLSKDYLCEQVPDTLWVQVNKTE